jgi:hypothetical protein
LGHSSLCRLHLGIWRWCFIVIFHLGLVIHMSTAMWWYIRAWSLRDWAHSWCMSIADSAINEIRNFTNIKKKWKKNWIALLLMGVNVMFSNSKVTCPLLYNMPSGLLKGRVPSGILDISTWKMYRVAVVHLWYFEIVGSPFLWASVRWFNWFIRIWRYVQYNCWH